LSENLSCHEPKLLPPAPRLTLHRQPQQSSLVTIHIHVWGMIVELFWGLRWAISHSAVPGLGRMVVRIRSQVCVLMRRLLVMENVKVAARSEGPMGMFEQVSYSFLASISANQCIICSATPWPTCQ
jgi:hypothetical protein